MPEKSLLLIFIAYRGMGNLKSYSWQEFADQTNIIDQKNITTADVQIKMVATLSNLETKGNLRCPPLGLIRF